jgi:CYTH domain-containing protein
MKYARIERERRYLLESLPTGLDAERTLEIHDRYLCGTGLRLRLVGERGLEPVRKLGQKIRLAGPAPLSVAHTTMYLTEEEYRVLLALAARELHKTRHLVVLDGGILAVDAFRGPLAGLITAEIDLGEHREMSAELPIDPVAEITDDERFSGGELAQASEDVLRNLLASHGIGFDIAR